VDVEVRLMEWWISRRKARDREIKEEDNPGRGTTVVTKKKR
jgi:hypothetical protein